MCQGSLVNQITCNGYSTIIFPCITTSAMLSTEWTREIVSILKECLHTIAQQQQYQRNAKYALIQKQALHFPIRLNTMNKSVCVLFSQVSLEIRRKKNALNHYCVWSGQKNVKYADNMRRNSLWNSEYFTYKNYSNEWWIKKIARETKHGLNKNNICLIASRNVPFIKLMFIEMSRNCLFHFI